jgi:hypothetical protein
MSVTIELPDDALARLRAEAERRGVSIDVIVAELADRLPAQATAHATQPLSFIGIGASGTTEPIGRRHREIVRDAHAQKTAKDA